MTESTKAILITILTVLIAACGDSKTDADVVLSGEADLNVQDNFTSCQIQQVGSNYLVRQEGGNLPYSMAFDQSIVYPPGLWLPLPEADALRVSPLTAEEAAAL